MKILAIDTSTTSCSVALLDKDQVLAETVFTAGQTHSRHLLPMIDHIMNACGCDFAAIDAIGVTRGPGTFTGLRIGISMVKGLCVATKAPVIGIGSLDALAFPFINLACPVIAMIDARRNEVYWVQFQTGGDVLKRKTQIMVSTPEKVAATIPNDAFLVGSGALAYRSVFESHCQAIRFADSSQNIIRGASVGMLAMARFMRRDLDAVDTVIPEYIRKSDAQIQISGTC